MMRRRMHRLGALTAALALAACSVSPSPVAVSTGSALHKWRVVQQEDAIFGSSLIATMPMGYNANLVTGDIRTGALDLMCFKRQPIIRIRFNFKVGSNASAAVAYRFDDKPGVDAKAKFLRDYSTVVIDDPSEVRRFLTGLSMAGKLLMRVDSLIVGATNIELDVQGGGLAAEQALANCPLPPVIADQR